MHRGDRADHDHDKTCGSKPGKKPCNQSKAAEGLSDDDKKGHEPRQAHFPCEKTHRSIEAISTKPAEEFLGAVRKNHPSESNS